MIKDEKIDTRQFETKSSSFGSRWPLFAKTWFFIASSLSLWAIIVMVFARLT